MTDSNGSTWFNALIGAIATVLLSFTVVSPVLGGALAGYLERVNGVRVGAIAGVIAALPVLLFALIGFWLYSTGGGAPYTVGLLAVITILVLVPAYIIGLSALGGYLGVYVRNELRG